MFYPNLGLLGSQEVYLENKYMDDTKKIFEFIKSQDLAVISTVTHDFLPQSAVVGISGKENLELIFGTANDSRKYQNLKKNPRVSLVIGWDQGKTVQYEGEVVELSGSDKEEAINIHLSKTPSAAKYLSLPQEAIFKIVPKWVKYSDVSVDPWDVTELKF
jgi:uncharacterized protein YhbP (UPF0306 family)